MNQIMRKHQTNQIRNLQNNWPINFKNVNVMKSRRNIETALAFNFQKQWRLKDDMTTEYNA